MANEKSVEYYKNALEGKKVPTLILDNKWHKLFPKDQKSKKILEIEESINELFKKQSRLINEVKNLKKVKTELMQGIVENMYSDDEVSLQDQQNEKLQENQKLILEINERIINNEDELLDIPREIKDTNELLMIESMDYCYKILHSNNKEIKEIADWINQVRIDLKKNIIFKQEKEQKNAEIYSYMHDILGPEIIDVFDMTHKDNVE